MYDGRYINNDLNSTISNNEYSSLSAAINYLYAKKHKYNFQYYTMQRQNVHVESNVNQCERDGDDDTSKSEVETTAKASYCVNHYTNNLIVKYLQFGMLGK